MNRAAGCEHPLTAEAHGRIASVHGGTMVALSPHRGGTEPADLPDDHLDDVADLLALGILRLRLRRQLAGSSDLHGLPDMPGQRRGFPLDNSLEVVAPSRPDGAGPLNRKEEGR
jgi:hypothetical protein